MKCPHCQVSFFEKWIMKSIVENNSSVWHTKSDLCPTCNKNTIYLVEHPRAGGHPKQEFLVFPRNASRPLPKEVTELYSKQFSQAVEVLPISHEASAAISRRCLQLLLREEAKVTPQDLSKEIQEVIDSHSLPSDLEESIDAIRIIGNFASHPIKSTNTGEIVNVEEGEAEWTLEVLEDLFDYYLVKPIIRKKKRDALNQKLEDAGKKPMK